MNFQTIPPVPSAKELLDITFRKTRERAKAKQFSGELWQRLQKRESLKIDMTSGNLREHLEQIAQRFPARATLSSFYGKLFRVTLDVPLYEKSLGALRWVMQQITRLQQQYARRISRENNVKRLPQLTKEFYGRISSILKQINPQLHYLNSARKIMRTYPDIKEGLFTVCLYGFPNVGKTTLLNKLAETKAKIAAYAFTTLTINSGFLMLQDEKVQVLDVPGTLARPEKMNLIEQQAELVLQELADAIVFVLDLSDQSGYSIAQQERLLGKVRRRKDTILYLSKADLLDPEQRAAYPAACSDVPALKQELLQRLEKRKIEENTDGNP